MSLRFGEWGWVAVFVGAAALLVAECGGCGVGGPTHAAPAPVKLKCAEEVAVWSEAYAGSLSRGSRAGEWNRRDADNAVSHLRSRFRLCGDTP